MMYASLTGPLVGLYFPLPSKSEEENRIALNQSKLQNLWCSIYTEKEVNEHIKKYGGQKLDAHFALRIA